MKNASLAPIVLFVYNRPWHTQQTVEALLTNPLASQSTLYVFSDGLKSETDVPNVNQVRNYVQSVRGFKEMYITESPVNAGLSQSVIGGVTSVLQPHGKAIIMEDDMVCATNFLQFMNDALHTYERNPRIFSVSGYSYPIAIPESYAHDVYVLPRASSWGWATWLNRWEQADWQVQDYQKFIGNREATGQFTQGGEDLLYMLKKQQRGFINSWAVRWTYTHYRHQAYGLYPRKSKIHNIGADNSGTHTPKTNKYFSAVHPDAYTLPPVVEPDEQIIKRLQAFFKPSLYRKAVNYWKLR